MSVRLRFALLYAGAFLISGLLIIGLVFFAVSSTAQVGASGSPVVRHPFAESFGPIADVVASLVVLVLLSVAVGWLLAGRLLRPVRVITAAARDISASNLSRRLRTGRRDDEFTRLGETLNDLFGRLEASFQAQRHFVANASHELRTPLTAERTLLQVALADPDADTATLRDACEQVLALGARTEHLIDALLTLATGERGIERPVPLDLAKLAARVVETRAEVASQHRVRLDARLDPGAGDGRPQAGGEPDREPDGQRPQVQRPRRLGGGVDGDPGWPGGGDGAQHRPGGPAGRAGPPVPPLPAPGRGTRQPPGRPRPRPGDRPRHRRRARRLD